MVTDIDVTEPNVPVTGVATASHGSPLVAHPENRAHCNVVQNDPDQENEYVPVSAAVSRFHQIEFFAAPSPDDQVAPFWVNPVGGVTVGVEPDCHWPSQHTAISSTAAPAGTFVAREVTVTEFPLSDDDRNATGIPDYSPWAR